MTYLRMGQTRNTRHMSRAKKLYMTCRLPLLSHEQAILLHGLQPETSLASALVSTRIATLSSLYVLLASTEERKRPKKSSV